MHNRSLLRSAISASACQVDAGCLQLDNKALQTEGSRGESLADETLKAGGYGGERLDSPDHGDRCGEIITPLGSSVSSLPRCTPDDAPYLYFTTWADWRIYAYDPANNIIAHSETIRCSRCKHSTGIAASTVDGEGRIWVYYAYDGIVVIAPDDMECQPTELTRERGLPVIRSMTYVSGASGDLIYATASDAETVNGASKYLTINPLTYEMKELGPIQKEHTFQALASRDEQVFSMRSNFHSGLADDTATMKPWSFSEIDPQTGARDEARAKELIDAFAIPATMTFYQDELYLLGHFANWGNGQIALAHPTSGDAQIVYTDVRTGAGNQEISTFTGAGATSCNP